MALSVAGLIAGSRALFNDRLDDNYVRDDISDQIDGVTKRLTLIARNIVDFTTDGAPANPVLLVNEVALATAVFAKPTGIVTTPAAAIAVGSEVYAEYYHTLVTDANYALWVTDAANFVGQTDPTEVAEGLASAMHNYVAAMAAEKMADISGWYYQSQAGNKNFNKDQISAKFLAIYTAKLANAEKLLESFYTRHGQRNAPAKAVANYRGVRGVTPRR